MNTQYEVMAMIEAQSKQIREASKKLSEWFQNNPPFTLKPKNKALVRGPKGRKLRRYFKNLRKILWNKPEIKEIFLP